jgi:ribosomal protein L16 Arg81 hydroxylase
MNDYEWHAALLDLVNNKTVSATWAVQHLNERDPLDLDDYVRSLMDLERETKKVQKSMHTYSKTQYDTRDGDVAQAALEALEAGISLEDLLKSNKTVKVWYGQLVADRNRAKAARQREAARQARLVEKQRQEDEIRAAVAEKLTPEELDAFGLNKKGAKK